MEASLIEFLQTLLSEQLKEDIKISSVDLFAPARPRLLYHIKTENSPAGKDFILHFRQRPFRGEEEIAAMEKARQRGVLLPEIVYYTLESDNPFEVPFRISELVQGENLQQKSDWFKNNYKNVVDSFIAFHKPESKEPFFPKTDDLLRFKEECMSALQGSSLIDTDLLAKQFDRVIGLHAHTGLDKSRTSLLHGDLHYTNILVDNQNRVYILDWELSSLGDYCFDLAQFKTRTLDFILTGESAAESSRIFNYMLERYADEFDDGNIGERMNYYMSEKLLELVWHSCRPKISAQWLPFFFDKLNAHMSAAMK